MKKSRLIFIMNTPMAVGIACLKRSFFRRGTFFFQIVLSYKVKD
jgi:hypothetical protein